MAQKNAESSRAEDENGCLSQHHTPAPESFGRR